MKIEPQVERLHRSSVLLYATILRDRQSKLQTQKPHSIALLLKSVKPHKFFNQGPDETYWNHGVTCAVLGGIHTKRCILLLVSQQRQEFSESTNQQSEFVRMGITINTNYIKNCTFFAPSGWPLRKSNNFRKEMQPLHDRVIFFVAGEFIISSSASVFVLRSTTRIWYLHMNYDPVTARCKLAFIIWGPSRPV